MASLSDVRVKRKISCQYIISMMSGHGPNPIFFNKKIGRPEYSLTPHPLRPITSHFSLISVSKWTSYVYHSLIEYRTKQSIQSKKPKIQKTKKQKEKNNNN